MNTQITYSDFKKMVIDVLKSNNNINLENVNLIELGLNSLQVMCIINELRQKQIKVSFSQLMEYPYLKSWWEIIKNQSQTLFDDKTIYEREIKIDRFPLTDVQHAYWIGRESTQILGGVSCHMYFEFKCKKIHLNRLKNAWIKVQYHHPLLRTKFLADGKQSVCERPYKDEITIYDFRNLDVKERNEKLQEIKIINSHRMLKVEEGQVADIVLSMLDDNNSIIHFDIDLLVADLKSIKIIFSDLLSAYEEKELTLSPSHWKFSDFIVNKSKEKLIDLQNAETYWKEQIKNLPGVPELPYCKKFDKIKNHKFNRRNYILDKERWILLKKYAAENQVTPAMIFLAIYSEVLERFSTVSEFLINIPLFNRPLEFENVVADFTNIILLPIDNTKECSFLDRVLQIKNKFLEIMKYSSYSGVRVIRDVIKNNPENKVIAPIVFSCDYGQTVISEKFENELGSLNYISSQTPQVLIDFQIMETPEGLILSWDAVEEAFQENVIETMFNSYIKSVNWIIDNFDKWNKELPIINKQCFDKRYSNMQTLGKRKHKCIHEKIFENSEVIPEKIAIVEADISNEISYKELAEKSKKLASVLIKNNIRKGDKVAIRLPRSGNQIIAALAVLAVGACYVPIGVNQPMNRVEQIVSKAGIKAIITDLTGINFIGNKINLSVINVEELEQQEEIPEIILLDPQESAYIIFTSGTTGEPKGVEISHAAAWNTIQDVNMKCHVKETDNLLSISSMEFDLSVYDIFGILGEGGTVVLIGEKKERDASSWVPLLNKYEITLWNSVPFLFDMLLSMAEEEKIKFIFLRKVMLSGDWIGLDLPERLKQVAPNADILAMGGATEAAIWSNFFEVKLPLPCNWYSIPYGKPLFGQIYRVADKKGRECPDWVPGELWIGGEGVAKGYVNDVCLTKEKFVNFKGIRWYKTGDVGRYWANGIIEFLGRNDTQIKIKGHRIELGEIEAAINKYDGIINSVVCVIDDSKSKSLGAYVVVDKKDDFEYEKVINQEELKKFLRSYLPEYMIPIRYYISENIPLTVNGKINKKKIKKILANHTKVSIKTFEAPKGKIEKELENIWKKVLKINRISRHDNFFEIGGDSLKAVSLISKVKKLDIVYTEISIQILFACPTISLLAKEIEKSNEELKSNMEIRTI